MVIDKKYGRLITQTIPFKVLSSGISDISLSFTPKTLANCSILLGEGIDFPFSHFEIDCLLMFAAFDNASDDHLWLFLIDLNFSL